MIQITSKEDCCGCAACAMACPKQCIAMEEDDEGFLYPRVAVDLCVACGLCEKVCPQQNLAKALAKEQHGYLVQIKDEGVRKESTSGGAFTGIAQYVIRNGGVVFGATYDAEWQVVHAGVDREAELYRFRNSKYVQSKIGNSFRQAKSLLLQNRLVCFSGTPCQIEGLLRYLQKDYDNLILVDVVCRAVPSPKLWAKYLEWQKNKYGNGITDIKFRDKSSYGYTYSQMTLYSRGVKCYHQGIESDEMLRAFFSNICDRPSCYQCRFKKRFRVSDFTIWDCFEPEKFCKTLDDNKGTTCVLVQSTKGQRVFEQVKESFTYAEVAPDLLVGTTREMFHSVETNPKREQLFIAMNSMSASDFWEKYFPRTLRIRCEHAVRLAACKLGIYKAIKKLSRLKK